MRFLIRIAHEINLKSPRVKARFLRRLVKNIHAAFRHSELPVLVEEKWSRLYVSSESDKAIDILQRIFGIGSISPLEQTSDASLDSIEETIRQHYGPRVGALHDAKVCLRVRKIDGAKGFQSLEREKLWGGLLASFGAGVNLKNPDFLLRIDCGPAETHFYSQTYAGPGGLPFGVEGKALCMFSGGFDSAVAAWQVMKRGVACDFVLFNLGGEAYEDSVGEVYQALKDRWIYGYTPKFFVVDFAPIVAAIHQNVTPRLAQVILKRTFLKCANLIAKIDPTCVAIISGESIGQVSSQTLGNICAIDEASQLTVIRPLIAMDKIEIIALSRKIGTDLTSQQVKEYCGISSQKPATNVAKIAAKSVEEASIPPDLYTSAVDAKRLLDTVNHARQSQTRYYCEDIPQDAHIIDTRSKSAYELWHYPGSINIPYDELVSKNDESALHPVFLRKDPFVLICDIGLQTASLAQILQEKGIAAKSYRGGAQSLEKKQLNSDLW